MTGLNSHPPTQHSTGTKEPPWEGTPIRMHKLIYRGGVLEGCFNNGSFLCLSINFEFYSMTFDICMHVWFWLRHHILKRCQMDWLSRWSGWIAATNDSHPGGSERGPRPVLRFADWLIRGLIVIFGPTATKISCFNEGLFCSVLEIFLNYYPNSCIVYGF